MEIITLIIGYIPLSDTVGKKPREIRDDKYFKELLPKFDLGEVHYAPFSNWKPISDELNPLFIIVLGGEYYAEEVHEYKKDAMLYATHDAGQIFYRKAEIEKKKLEQLKVLTELADFVARMKSDPEQIPIARKFASMSYNDLYQMIVQSIIGEDEKLRQNAWKLLMDNNGHKNFIWMRAQLICEIWQEAKDGKVKEEFLCLAMDQHVDEQIARKMDNFTDSEGQQYHQYMFCNFFGDDMNYIRRIPFGFKGQDKWAYEALLTKYETPTGPQMMLEAGQMRSEKAKYIKNESEKIVKVLTAWKADPTKSKYDLGVIPWNKDESDKEPLTESDIKSLEMLLREYDQATVDSLGLN